MSRKTELAQLNKAIAELSAKKAELAQEAMAEVAAEIKNIETALERIRDLRDEAGVSVDLDAITELVQEILDENPNPSWDSSNC